jgi:DNA-binding CsgD family transcriptional regulator
MGISINSIKSHLKLAIKSLKNHLHNIKWFTRFNS